MHHNLTLCSSGLKQVPIKSGEDSGTKARRPSTLRWASQGTI